MSAKRIAKEFAECNASPPEGMTLALADESNVQQWHITLTGPPKTVYEGGTYGIILSLPETYPFKPPTVNFITRIYHPNITNDSLGNICLSMLKSENWKPASKLRGLLEAIRQLLIEPQPEDPLEARIADEFKNDRVSFDKSARAYVSRYAKGPISFNLSAPATTS